MYSEHMANSNPNQSGIAAYRIPRLPAGLTLTKPYRFTLRSDLAQQLEQMSKAERDLILTQALELAG